MDSDAETGPATVVRAETTPGQLRQTNRLRTCAECGAALARPQRKVCRGACAKARANLTQRERRKRRRAGTYQALLRGEI